MDGNTAFSIFCLALLILLSSFFSASETAFNSLNLIRVKNLANGGNKRAQLVLSLLERYDKLLSTLLIGNNIVNITAASLATLLFVGFYGDIGATIATIVTTLVLLVFGEITPKSMAKESPEAFTMAVSSIVHGLVILFTPLTYVFGLVAKLAAKLARPSGSKKITEAELLALLQEAEMEGAINEEDTELIQNAIAFNDQIVSDILTPRVDVEGVPIDATKDEIVQLYLDSGYTRLAIYSETLDNILGILLLKDFFAALMRGEEPDLKFLMNPVIFVSPSLKVADLFKKLQQARCHFAVVTDEYGGTMGIVTMEDVLEELVGEIWDEHDEVTQDYQQTGEGIYLVRGAANCDAMFEHFGIETSSEANTISGWIMERLGKIPNVGDGFEIGDFKVVVTALEQHRITECLLMKKTEDEPSLQA